MNQIVGGQPSSRGGRSIIPAGSPSAHATLEGAVARNPAGKSQRPAMQSKRLRKGLDCGHDGLSAGSGLEVDAGAS